MKINTESIISSLKPFSRACLGLAPRRQEHEHNLHQRSAIELKGVENDDYDDYEDDEEDEDDVTKTLTKIMVASEAVVPGHNHKSQFTQSASPYSSKSSFPSHRHHHHHNHQQDNNQTFSPLNSKRSCAHRLLPTLSTSFPRTGQSGRPESQRNLGPPT